MELVLPLILLLFLTFCSGFFSASETALFSLSPTKIKAYSSSSDTKKRLIAHLVSRPRDLLVTIFMLNTLVNILLQNTTSHMFGESANWGYKVGIPLVLMLFVGEIVPKYIGLLNNIKISHLVAKPINLLQNLIRPLRILTINVTAPVSRALFFYLKPEESISRDELKHVLKTSQEYGVLHADEAELVGGYINLQEATVKEIMRPREDILSYDLNDPLSKLLYLFIDQECSRLPVCDKSIENVLGIITAKQFFLHRHQINSGKDLIPLLLKTLYVPESIPAKNLIRRFDENNQVLALVVDEYGSISGIVTREDLVEVVIGEITDLRDATALFTKVGQHEIIGSGKLELSEFNEIFNSNLISPNNMMTIGGWLTEQLGEIPKNGTRHELHGFIFNVLAADPHRIRRLYIRRLN
jgi:putative hemolysin